MTTEELTNEIERLRAENAGLKKRVGELEAVVEQMKARLEEAERASKRQAAPFSKGKPKQNPKKPGRKPGHRGAHRAKPQRVDQIEEAALPEQCPSCGGTVLEEKVHAQYQVEIPPVKPVVTQFNVQIGHCLECGRRVQGRHGQQTSDALGGAAVQLGPRALALAAEVKHELGVPYDKVRRLCESGFGLVASRAAFARADQRLAKRSEPLYQKLIEVLRQSQAVWVDETGWKIGGHRAWLWVFTTESVTVYQIDPARAHEVVQGMLGDEFGGVLHSDCFLAYDPLPYRQQRCVQHLLRRSDALTASKSRPAVVFSPAVARLLPAAIHLRHRLRDQKISPHGYRVARGRLERGLDRLLEGHYTDPDNAKLAKLLRKHRDQLLVFLYQDDVEPTNAAAEREIRPAVVVRKTSACNRSPTGAQTHAILTSLMRTCRKQGVSFLKLAMDLLRHPNLSLPDWLSNLLDRSNAEAMTSLVPAKAPPR